MASPPSPDHFIDPVLRALSGPTYTSRAAAAPIPAPAAALVPPAAPIPVTLHQTTPATGNIFNAVIQGVLQVQQFLVAGNIMGVGLVGAGIFIVGHVFDAETIAVRAFAGYVVTVLNNLPLLREFTFNLHGLRQYTTWDLNSVRASVRISMAGYLVGTQMAPDARCDQCTEGWGIFAHCVVVRGVPGSEWWRGGCVNCGWGGHPQDCSFAHGVGSSGSGGGKGSGGGDDKKKGGGSGPRGGPRSGRKNSGGRKRGVGPQGPSWAGITAS